MPFDPDPPDAGGKIPFIRMLKGGFLMGQRVSVIGDIYPVLEKDQRPKDKTGTSALMPPVVNDGTQFPVIDRDRAVALIERRIAIKDTGPAKFIDAEQPKPETASMKQPAQAERAVSQPQRSQRGSM